MKKQDRKYTIICLSNQFYRGVSKTNKHFVMEELAKRGHKVVFVDPPTRFKALKNFIKTAKFGVINKVNENLVVYTPVNLLNFAPFSILSNQFHARLIKKLINDIGGTKNKKVLWAYHFDFPRIFDLKKNISPDVFIYDVVDNYEAFPEYSRLDTTNTGFIKVLQKIDTTLKSKLDQKGLIGKEWVRYIEKKLAKNTDLMFSSHPLLFERFRKLNKKTYYTPNAGLYSNFSQKPKEIPKKLSKIPHPRVLYAGAIDSYKLDVDLLIKTARATPKIHYAVVGESQLSDSDNRVGELEKLNNIHLTGPLPAADAYAHFYDAYTIPYNINDYVYYGCFPIKFLNALSTGVPVVVTDLPCYKGFEDVLYIGKDYDDFINKIKAAVKDKNEAKKKHRIKVASQNTWEHKVDKQLAALKEFFNSK